MPKKSVSRLPVRNHLLNIFATLPNVCSVKKKITRAVVYYLWVWYLFYRTDVTSISLSLIEIKWIGVLSDQFMFTNDSFLEAYAHTDFKTAATFDNSSAR